MNPLGLLLMFFGGVTFLIALIWIYSTTMTVRRSTISPWALLLAAVAIGTGVTGIVLF